MSGDDREPRSWADREKLSFSELDRRRKEKGRGGESRPRGEAARERSAAATQQYLKQVDTMFSKGKGGAEGERLERAVRDALGTSGLADACRAYRDTLGVPDDPSLLSHFLDSGDSDVVLAAIEALRSPQGGEAPGLTRGLRSQLRMLAEGSDDAVAEAAEELLDERDS